MVTTNIYSAKVGFWKTKDPYPKHDFSAFEDTEYARTSGLIAASQKQLEEQLKSKLRLDPKLTEIRYFYYEANNVGSENKISSTE